MVEEGVYTKSVTQENTTHLYRQTYTVQGSSAIIMFNKHKNQMLDKTITISILSEFNITTFPTLMRYGSSLIIKLNLSLRLIEKQKFDELYIFHTITL